MGAKKGLRDRVTNGRSGDAVTERPPPPGLGPQALTRRARAPQRSSRLGDSSRRARSRSLPASLRTTRKQPPRYRRHHALSGSTTLGPALPPATERARSGSLAISGAHGFLLPLVFSSSSSMLPSPCSGCDLPPLTPAKHPN